MSEPKYATLLLDSNVKYPIEKIHYKTRQVTLREKPNLFNTVSVKNVIWDCEGMTEEEKQNFINKFKE